LEISKKLTDHPWQYTSNAIIVILTVWVMFLTLPSVKQGPPPSHYLTPLQQLAQMFQPAYRQLVWLLIFCILRIVVSGTGYLSRILGSIGTALLDSYRDHPLPSIMGFLGMLIFVFWFLTMVDTKLASLRTVAWSALSSFCTAVLTPSIKALAETHLHTVPATKASKPSHSRGKQPITVIHSRPSDNHEAKGGDQ